MMFDMFATLGFMQNRQNGPLAHGAPWRTAQAAHSTRLWLRVVGRRALRFWSHTTNLAGLDIYES